MIAPPGDTASFRRILVALCFGVWDVQRAMIIRVLISAVNNVMALGRVT
jgi:hypothetical protein